MTSLFHVSDIHFGAEDKAALAWFAAAVEETQPDAIVLTGDLTFRARRREFAAASDWLRGLARPLVIGPGNHDLPYFDLFERFAAPYRRYQALADVAVKPLELPGVTIVALDTTAHFQWRFNWAEGRVTAKRLNQAVAQTASAPAGHTVLIACHHPLTGAVPGHEAGTRNGEAALAALTKAGADAFLSGHVHTPFELTRTIGERQVRLIGAGTLSERLRGHPPSFNIVRIEDEGVQVSLQNMA